ncbi:MAG: AMP-binding protein [Candidatus Gracilibacteria bacterium]|nr:AMP-binding protein [Candidatus Gracilibacteria bacterium]
MKILLFLVRKILSLRYSVKISGTEQLSHTGPILLLSNHIALVDPRIMIAFLGKYLPVSPVASEKYYNKPVLKQVMDLVGTVPIGEVSAGASSEEVSNTFGNITKALAEGKNILIYPSGQIYRQNFESIKGKQTAFQIIQTMPENTKVIGIRQSGLWGSIWSMAWDNGKTSFGGIYIKSIWYVFANLIFFVPKRKVNIQIEDITESIKNHSHVNSCNNFLEDFYNHDKKNEDIFLRHYFYYNDVKKKILPEMISGSIAELEQTNDNDITGIDPEIIQNIKEKISQIKEISISDIQDDSKLILDLYFDSLDASEIKSFVQANFVTASNPPIGDLKTVSDLYIMAVGKSQNIEDLKTCVWSDVIEAENIHDISESIDTEKNIVQNWKENFKKNKSDSYMWDNILGGQTKKDCIIKIYLISKYIKQIEGKYVGVMLPSVGSAPLIIMAIYLAGKIPVMFNWTLGKTAFDHCVKFSKVTTILTSSTFYDKVKNDFLEDHKSQDRFLFLEDLLKNVKITEKLSAVIYSLFMPLPEIKKEDPAVILFTSGSESLPKAVSLSHKNLVSDITGALEVFQLKTNDRLLGFLPPFHSFGFTINTIMPLISGLEVVYTPDPNDAKTILEIIKHTQVSAVTSTPTFLKMIMNLASGDDIQSVKYAVVGAEKCPSGVFDRFQELSPKGKILEGYGITECSPVVSINPIEHSKPGTVGKIIGSLDCKILDVNTNHEVSQGEQGMIYLSGDSIFEGYLDETLESPFITINDNTYYKTGDLGLLDSEGYLSITGRLKRFIKIAGEMVSLPFIEEVLSEKYGSNDEVTIAIEALENEGEAKIVLFSIHNIVLEDVNTYLRSKGISNLIKISEVIQIDEIPVLGTGKTDYKILKEKIKFS